MKGLKETLRKIKPDIVHCHNLHPHLFQVMEWKAELKYKLVAQLHHPIATGIDQLLARLLYKFAIRELVKNQHKIDIFITHTNMEKQWLINKGIEKDKVHIIRYPCIPDELLNYRPKTDIHKKLGARIVITCISRIHPRKGQHLLIEAAKHIKVKLKNDYVIYIAGPVANRKYLEKLRKQVEQYNLRKYIVINPNPLMENEKRDIIATSDIFVCTPIKDIHPIVLIEALALKTPIVTTKVGAIPELLDLNIIVKELTKDVQGRLKALLEWILWDDLKRLEGNAIILTEPKSIEIAKAIYQVLQNKDKINLETFTKVASTYATSVVVSKLVKLYELLIP